MRFPNRLKFTINATGVAVLLAANETAITDFRTPAQAIAAGELAVGDTLPLVTDDGAGNWEASHFTVTDASTLTRTAIVASSNGGAAVTFAGTPTVFCDPFGVHYAAFYQASSARVYYTSKVGAVDDADLSEASTTFGTDSTAAIQSVLNTASTTNPIKVVFDGRHSVTGLRIKGNTTIEALPGCGAILRTGSNKSLWENYNITFVPANRVDANITIKGGIWNGNRGPISGSDGTNNNRGSSTTGLNCVFRFYGVTNLNFEPDTLLCSPCYSSHVMNCKRVMSRGVKHDCGANQIVNNDGHNTGGNCSDLVYRDLTLNTGDDPLSISPDDVWGQTGASAFWSPFYPTSAMGPIKNVLVDNLNLQTHIYGVRLMAPTSRLDNVVIRNVTGSTTWWAILLDNLDGTLPSATGTGNIGNVTIDGVDVAVTGTAVIRIKSSVEKLIIRNLHRSSFGDAIPTILIDGTGVTIGSLEIDGYDSNDSTSSFAVPHIKMAGGTIRELKIRGATVRRAGAANGSYLLQLTGSASIGTLHLNNILLDGIDNLVYNQAGTITRIAASNIVHLNPASGAATFTTASTIPQLVLSNYIGTTATAGTFTTTGGDGFAAGAAAATDTTKPTVVTTGASAPTVTAATPTRLVITASETLNTSFVPDKTTFAVSGHTPSAVSISGNQILVDFTAAMSAGESQTVTWTPSGTNDIRDLAGNTMLGFGPLAITDNVGAVAGYVNGATKVTIAGDANVVQSGNTIAPATTSGGGYHNYIGAVPTQKLAAGVDGWVGMQYTGPCDAQVGFNQSGFASPTLGFTFSGGKVIPLASGAGQGTQPAVVVNNLYRVRCKGLDGTGTNGVFLETSPADGSNWTQIFNYGAIHNADLTVACNVYNSTTSVVSYLQGAGLS